MNDIKRMADEERAIFKKFRMESIAPRGKWNLMYNERKNASEAKKNTRNADKVAQVNICLHKLVIFFAQFFT